MTGTVSGRLVPILALCLLLAGCLALRRERAAAIAEAAGFRAREFDAGAFVLAGFERGTPARGGTLTVYLEGDGRAWVSRTQLAEDPTPSDPLALRLAAVDPAPAILYLARPCQYVEGAAARHCTPFYWSSGRLAPEVVDAAIRAIDAAMAESGAASVELLGYSGGGALAVLIAARRRDVLRVVTIAADLDLAAWTHHHGVTPMRGSLDPVAEAARVAALPQLHYVGADDEIVPPSIVEGFRRAAGLSADRLVVVPGYTHNCCWAETWPDLVARARQSAASAEQAAGSGR